MKAASQTTVITAAALIDFVTEVTMQVSDQEFTDQLNGSVVARSTLDQMVAASVLRHLSPAFPQPNQA